MQTVFKNSLFLHSKQNYRHLYNVPLVLYMEEQDMHWQRTLQTVDVHCEGEIGRVITNGVLDIPGQTAPLRFYFWLYA